MLSSQVKFSADRLTDTGKTVCPRSIDAGQNKIICPRSINEGHKKANENMVGKGENDGN